MLGNHTTAPLANQFHVIVWGGRYYFLLRVKKFISHGLVPPPSSTLNTTFPETDIAPENGWLECYSFLLGPGLFSGTELLVSSFREGILRWFPLKSHSASITCCPGICPRSSRAFARHGGDVDAAVNDVVEKLLKVPEGLERVIPQKWHLQSYFYECGILIFYRMKSHPNEFKTCQNHGTGESTSHVFSMSRLHWIFVDIFWGGSSNSHLDIDKRSFIKEPFCGHSHGCFHGDSRCQGNKQMCISFPDAQAV